MKYSILTLLAATGYAALTLAALNQPWSPWRYAAMLAWLAILAYLYILSIDPMSHGAALFGRVALALIASYIVLTIVGILTFELERRRQWQVLPHQQLAAWWATTNHFKAPAAPAPSINGDYRKATVEPMLAYNCALVFGLVGGTAAVCRHRRLECKNANAKSNSLDHVACNKVHRESGGP